MPGNVKTIQILRHSMAKVQSQDQCFPCTSWSMKFQGRKGNLKGGLRHMQYHVVWCSLMQCHWCQCHTFFIILTAMAYVFADYLLTARNRMNTGNSDGRNYPWWLVRWTWSFAPSRTWACAFRKDADEEPKNCCEAKHKSHKSSVSSETCGTGQALLDKWLYPCCFTAA